MDTMDVNLPHVASGNQPKREHVLTPLKRALLGMFNLNDPRWGSEDPAHWGSLLLAQADGIDERRLPTLAGAYPSFYRQVAAAIRNGTPPPVDPASVVPVIRILEDLAQQAG